MSDETFGLSIDISGAIYDDFCERGIFRFGGQSFQLEDSEEGDPFLLTRKSDGKQFEVTLEATVTEARP